MLPIYLQFQALESFEMGHFLLANTNFLWLDGPKTRKDVVLQLITDNIGLADDGIDFESLLRLNQLLCVSMEDVDLLIDVVCKTDGSFESFTNLLHVDGFTIFVEKQGWTRRYQNMHISRNDDPQHFRLLLFLIKCFD